MKIITTSWDDGHPLDFKLAEMLERHNLAATFYIPEKNSEREVMTASQIKELSINFEIGGHTLNHTILSSKKKLQAAHEISGSYLWLSDLLGYNPESFCFPGGKCDEYLIKAVYRTGYKLARSAELLSSSFDAKHFLFPTTLQVYERSAFIYARHLLKRKRFISLLKFLCSNSSCNISRLTEKYVSRIPDDGFFHLWGHSWEIEQYGLWKKLDDIFSIISNQPQISYTENKNVYPYYALSA